MKLINVMNPNGRWPFEALGRAIAREMIIVGFEEGKFIKCIN